ncbi:DMT family transporter [Ekhidna sp.]
MKIRNVYLLILLASCWGPSFLFIKIAVAEISPVMLAALRIGIGAVILNLILLLKKEKLPVTLVFWKKTFIAGFFAQGLPFTLINWGEQFVDSSLASLINGLVPLCTIVLSQIMLRNERMTKNKLTGVLLGFIGLAVLVMPNLLSGVTGSSQGILSITAAAFSYGFGLVYIKKYLINIPSFRAPAAQLLSVAIYLLPMAFLADSSFSLMEVSWQAIGAVAILGLFGTAVAFVIYFKLIEQSSVAYASLVTYLMPVYGVILGIIFLNEQFTLWMFLGAVLILAGIRTVNKPLKSKMKVFGEGLDAAYFTKFR